jgi:hypothetical protein
MLEPIVLPNRAAGLDLGSKPPSGTWMDQAFGVNCQPATIQSGCSMVVWGTNNEVSVAWDGAARRPTAIYLANDYSGQLDFKSADGVSYTMAPYNVTRNGKLWLFGWGTPSFEANVDEIYRALTTTFAPATALDPDGTTCIQTKKCHVTYPTGADVGGSVMYDALGLELFFFSKDEHAVAGLLAIHSR